MVPDGTKIIVYCEVLLFASLGMGMAYMDEDGAPLGTASLEPLTIVPFVVGVGVVRSRVGGTSTKEGTGNKW